MKIQRIVLRPLFTFLASSVSVFKFFRCAIDTPCIQTYSKNPAVSIYTTLMFMLLLTGGILPSRTVSINRYSVERGQLCTFTQTLILIRSPHGNSYLRRYLTFCHRSQTSFFLSTRIASASHSFEHSLSQKNMINLNSGYQ